jgi:hypothetical protein
MHPGGAGVSHSRSGINSAGCRQVTQTPDGDYADLP